MVLPLMARSKLSSKPATVHKLKTGHRALIYPAIPVVTSKLVCRLLTRGKYWRDLVRIVFIGFLLSMRIKISQTIRNVLDKRQVTPRSVG